MLKLLTAGARLRHMARVLWLLGALPHAVMSVIEDPADDEPGSPGDEDDEDECEPDAFRPCEEDDDDAPGWFQNVVNYLSDGINGFSLNMVEFAATFWMELPSPTLDAGSGDSPIEAGERPEAMAAITDLLGWIQWLGYGIAGVSVMVIGALMWKSRQRGEPATTVGTLGTALMATAVLSGATALVAGVLPAGPTAGTGVVALLQNAVWWPMAAMVVAMLLVGAINVLWAQDVKGAKQTAQALLTLLVAAAAGLTAMQILIEAADAWADWVTDNATEGDLREDLVDMLSLDVLQGMSAVGRLVWAIILAVLLGIASLIQALVMLMRYGILQMLAGLLPLAASLTFTESGREWWRRYVGWTLAFVLYKPAAAVVYATGLMLFGQDFRVDPFVDVYIGVLAGVLMLVLAVFTLPALMRAVAPPVGPATGSGGGIGAVAMGAAVTAGVGAAAGALGLGGGGATGAANAAGNATGTQGGGPAGTGPSNSGPAGSTGSTGGSTGGGGPAGSSDDDDDEDEN